MSLSRPRVMIVDDDPSTINLLANVLDEDFDLIIATDGKQALQLAIENQLPDLILLDIMMPGLDGFDVLIELNKKHQLQKVPVIFITAKDSVANESKGLDLGAVDFITKPFSPSIVLARVKTHIKLHQQTVLLEKGKAVLEARETLLSATLNSSKDGIIVLDEHLELVIFNNRFIEMWQFPKHLVELNDTRKLIEYGANQLIDGDMRVANISSIMDADVINNEILEFKDGRIFSRYLFPLISSSSTRSFVVNYTDITDFKKLESSLRSLSLKDSLTGLHNRRGMDEILLRECVRAKRAQHILGLLVIDIDYFKEVNDEHGHEKGDKVLEQVAKYLIRPFREVDYCCRYGGDEFVVIMSDTTVEGMLHAGERLLSIFRNQTIEGLAVRLSIGAATNECLADADESRRLFLHADKALYQAKTQGRDQIFFYDKDLVV